MSFWQSWCPRTLTSTGKFPLETDPKKKSIVTVNPSGVRSGCSLFGFVIASTQFIALPFKQTSLPPKSACLFTHCLFLIQWIHNLPLKLQQAIPPWFCSFTQSLNTRSQWSTTHWLLGKGMRDGRQVHYKTKQPAVFIFPLCISNTRPTASNSNAPLEIGTFSKPK